MARRRVLHPEEKELWQAVARTARARPDKALPDVIGGDQPKAIPDKAPQVFAPPPIPAFRLGEKSRSSLPNKPLTQKVSPPSALLMDANVFSKMTRGKIAPDARLDLHGMTLSEAHPALVGFVLNAKSAGQRLLLVITGKGKTAPDFGPIPQRMGALRHQVPQWLRQPPLGHVVLQVTESHQRHGGSGAFYVYLRRGQ